MRYRRTPSAIASTIAGASLFAGGCLLLWSCAELLPREGWSGRWGPLVPHTKFPGDCSICHIPDDWKTLRDNFEFDHAKETGYVLEGAHSRAACLRCHNDRGPILTYVERGCGGCHVDPHRGSLGLDCSECHNQELWEPLGLIADHARTRFPLIGMHALTACESCHPRSTAADFAGAPVECHLCHQRDALLAQPSHVPNGWTVNCHRCHSPSDWDAPLFDHDFFPLIGGHANVACAQCHPGSLFTPISPACFACHQQDYLAAPNHVASGFSTDCTLCHTIVAW